MKLLVTDLDNTLYDWVGFFAPAFEAMVVSLARHLACDEETLYGEFKSVHQRYRSSEQPFAVLEVPSVVRRYPNASRGDLLRHLQEPLERFNEARKSRLVLYPEVAETLSTLVASGVRVVGHTEALAVNAVNRLGKLGILDRFTRLYALEGELKPHPDPTWRPEVDLKADFLREVPQSERKPNPELLREICRREQCELGDAVYVGDSIARDIVMAKSAGVLAVWARYGAHPDPRLWSVLVKVTHWTAEDVSREAELKKAAATIRPDVIIDSFAELTKLA